MSLSSVLSSSFVGSAASFALWSREADNLANCLYYNKQCEQHLATLQHLNTSHLIHITYWNIIRHSSPHCLTEPVQMHLIRGFNNTTQRSVQNQYSSTFCKGLKLLRVGPKTRGLPPGSNSSAKQWQACRLLPRQPPSQTIIHYALRFVPLPVNISGEIDLIHLEQ